MLAGAVCMSVMCDGGVGFIYDTWLGQGQVCYTCGLPVLQVYSIYSTGKLHTGRLHTGKLHTGKLHTGRPGNIYMYIHRYTQVIIIQVGSVISIDTHPPCCHGYMQVLCLSVYCNVRICTRMT